MIKFRSTFWTVAALTMLASVAHADYQTDKDNRNLDNIERALNKFTPDPSIYDGKNIAEGVSPDKLRAHHANCDKGLQAYGRYFKYVSAKTKNGSRARAIHKRALERQNYCTAMGNKANAYLNALHAAAQKRAAAAKQMEQTCGSLYRAANAADRYLLHTLDTWRGARTPMNVKDMTEFRARVDKLDAVCKQPKFKGVTEGCAGQGIMMSSETNQRFNYGDICKPLVDKQKFLSDTAMRAVDYMSKTGRKAVTLQSFRYDKGWIPHEGKVLYKTYFQVSDEVKKRLTKTVNEVFAAAGVEPPKDLSVLWAKQQQYFDTLKTAVDATVGEWNIRSTKCRGYACNLAKKSIKRSYGRVRIKSVFARDWHIRKNALGVPLDKSLVMTIVFQVPGEPSCQARTLTATEVYKGGGRYKRAKGLNWGYARFQKCQ